MKESIHLIKSSRAAVRQAAENLAININARNRKDQTNLLLFCGTGAASKTMAVTMETAIAFAEAGQKTVLVNANLREPLKKKKPVGLSGYVLGEAEADAIVYPTNQMNLHYVPADIREVSPAKILSSKRICVFMQNLKKQFDCILIDCAPMPVFSDAVILSLAVDAVYLVASSGITSYSDLVKAKNALEKIGAGVRGVILDEMPIDTCSNR